MWIRRLCSWHGSTLLPSFSLIVLSTEKKIVNYIKSIIRYSVVIFFTIFAFRIDLFINIEHYNNLFLGFAGGTLFNRLFMYFSFVSSYFFAPKCIALGDAWSQSYYFIFNIDFIGVFLLLSCIVSYILTRKNVLSRISLYWIIISFIILVFYGLGSSENGLIIYCVYFGWAFMILIYELLRFVSSKAKSKIIIPIFTITFVISLIYTNIARYS